MFHKNVLNAANISPLAPPGSIQTPNNPARLVLVPSGGGSAPQKRPSPFIDLIAISAHRCSSFFAEAAVLVLVLVASASRPRRLADRDEEADRHERDARHILGTGFEYGADAPSELKANYAQAHAHHGEYHDRLE